MSFIDPPVDSAGHDAKPPMTAKLYSVYFKRILDVSLVIFSLPVVLPFIGIMALLVAMDGSNPFYSQIRLGRASRTFRIWKLRTMVPDADAKLREYLDAHPSARKEWGAKQKLTHDPRVTLIGRILRKTSIDELPQLYNVLTGDMSLVGPRPMMINQKSLYPGRAYFALRPGITGPWQVSDRHTSTFAARAKFDTEYYKTLSFAEDLRLLVATVRVVLRGTGC
ncbi:sugar transferase [Jannaschia sp. 2305UL9-9]|uniref:sugar transferase n=1 Tax=Jannaschia sp. 2305UL9-9 TaxID=3121638 RepID=UPI003528E3EC